MKHFLQSQPIQDATPLRQQKHLIKPASNQETGPTTLTGNQTTDASPLTQLNPDVYPYVPPSANDLHQRGQTQPNVTSTNAAQNSTFDVENPSILQAHLSVLRIRKNPKGGLTNWSLVNSIWIWMSRQGRTLPKQRSCALDVLYRDTCQETAKGERNATPVKEVIQHPYMGTSSAYLRRLPPTPNTTRNRAADNPLYQVW